LQDQDVMLIVIPPPFPLLPNKSISLKQTIIGGEFGDNLLYPIEIFGTFQNGQDFLYVEQVQITPPSNEWKDDKIDSQSKDFEQLA
jgi:hypothetical protein